MTKGDATKAICGFATGVIKIPVPPSLRRQSPSLFAGNQHAQVCADAS